VGNLEYLGFQEFSDFWERIMADKLDPKGKWICFGHEMQRILFGTEAFHEVVPCGGVKTHVCCCRETCYTYNNMISLAFPILWALELWSFVLYPPIYMFRILPFWKQFFWGLGTQFYTKLNLTLEVPFCSQNFVQIVSMCTYPCTTFLQNTLTIIFSEVFRYYVP